MFWTVGVNRLPGASNLAHIAKDVNAGSDRTVVGKQKGGHNVMVGGFIICISYK